MEPIEGQGPPPDLTARYMLKAKYQSLQRKYHKSLMRRKDLKLEVAEKEAKVARLQDEIDLVIDQVYATDYAHLLPKDDDLFSDEEENRPNGISNVAGHSNKGKEKATINGDASLEDDTSLTKATNGLTNGLSNGTKIRKERTTISPSSEQAFLAEHPPKRARLDFPSLPSPSNGHPPA